MIRFYKERDIPIKQMVTAGSFEGGDFMIVEPGVVAIGTGEERTQEQAARQVAGWLEQEGWEVRVERIPSHFLHIDVLACMLGEKLAAVCVEQVGSGFVRWLEGKGVEIVPVSLEAALKLGVNGVCLGGDRVLSTAESKDLNERLRALGLTVYDPELSMFTLGGGGAHCLMQAIRRERVAALSPAAGSDRHPQRAQRAVAGPAQRCRRGRAPAGCSRASPRSAARPGSTFGIPGG